jgi:AraC-like DNA-binding protein
MLNGLSEFMSIKGLDFSQQTGRVGIDQRLADDPDAFIEFSSMLELFEQAAHDSKDDDFGLHFAQFCPLCPIGLFHYVISNAPTLREALKVRVRFAKLVVSAYELSFNEDEGVGYYVWHGPDQSGPRRQFLDYVVMLLVERVKIMLSDPTWLPLSVSFQHAKPRSLGEHHRALGPRLQFDASKTCVVFDQHSLERQLPKADSALHAELQRVAGTMAVAPSRAETLSDKIRRSLVESFVKGGVTEESMAAEFGLSVRTMQRSLAEIGTTFELLRADTRMKTAEQYLVDSDLALTEIAFLLGFSELSAFSRAARAWFGQSASSVRRNSRGHGT